MLKSLLRQFFRNRLRGRNQEVLTAQPSQPSDMVILQAVRRYDAGDLAGAQAIAKEIVRDDPRHHQAWNLLGAVAAAAENHKLAVCHFERAIALQPANAEYLSNCGEAFRRDGRVDDAIEYCRAALAVDAQHAGTYYNLALALFAVGEVEQAYAAYRNALAIRPDARVTRSGLLFLLCHHSGIDAATVLAEHRRWNELHARPLAPKSTSRALDTKLDRKLRIGYVSADFRRHALAYFMEPLLANHDRDCFDVFCYNNSSKADEVTERLRGYASQWRDIAELSDEAAARLVAQDGIDILVDLSGHTAGNRLLMFARKPAPVQVSYIGYLNTTGLQTMDCRVSDSYADPPGVSDALHTEKLLRMPHSQWCYRPPADIPDINPLPASQRGVVTFGSVHKFTKINRKVIELWAHMLARQADSELLIAGVPVGETGRRLREQFAAYGVSADRLRLVGKLTFDDYWRLYHQIDIGLDAFPYNGATTTCESLWMGVPIVTLAGHYAAARSGVSLLTSVGLPDLIAESPGQFVETATSLGRDPYRLAGLRASLRDRMMQSPLMDEPSFTRAFEAVLRSAFRPASSERP